MAIQERYSPVVIGANATVTIRNIGIGGFLAKTAGTISVVDSYGVTIINAHPVAAGTYYPLPFSLGQEGGTFTTAGGASGTIAV
jgi:hypothetical protein